MFSECYILGLKNKTSKNKAPKVNHYGQQSLPSYFQTKKKTKCPQHTHKVRQFMTSNPKLPSVLTRIMH